MTNETAEPKDAHAWLTALVTGANLPFADDGTLVVSKASEQDVSSSAQKHEVGPSTADHFKILIDYFFNDEQGFENLLKKIDLEGVMQILVLRYGNSKVRAALARTRKPRLQDYDYAIRHALALLCKDFGFVSDFAAAEQLASVFPSKRIDDVKSRTDSLRKALKEAREHCARSPALEHIACYQATAWREVHPGKDLKTILRNIGRRWKTQTPF